MPLPTPNENEPERAFLGRCMGDEVMNREFPENARRYGICNGLWRRKRGGKAPGAKK